MSQAFLPTLRSRMTSAFTPDDTVFDDESAFSAPSVGNTGAASRPSLSRSGAPSLNEAISPTLPPYQKYLSDLQDVSGKLMAAYQAPQPGAARQLLGALFARKNPQLGAVISGQAQRERTIEPLQQQYGLLSNALSSSFAREKTIAEINKDRYVPARTGVFDVSTQAMVPGSTQTATPQEQAMSNLQSQINPDTQKLYTPSEAYQKTLQMGQDVKPDVAVKPTDEDKAISDYLSGKNLPNTPANRDQARSVLKTRDRKPADQDLADINKQLKQAQLNKAQEPSPDEQRRADLARNLEENLNNLEDIARRRPELFGPVAGRMTGARQAIGSSDPDVAALKVIEEQTGLAMVGAHAMRNAQHAEKAAQSITGANHTPASALLAPNGPIAKARESLATFKQDAQRRKLETNDTGDQSAAPPVAPALQIIRDPKTGRITGIQ